MQRKGKLWCSNARKPQQGERQKIHREKSHAAGTKRERAGGLHDGSKSSAEFGPSQHSQIQGKLSDIEPAGNCNGVLRR